MFLPEPIHRSQSPSHYDTPGLTITRLAYIVLEGLVLDARVRELRGLFVTSTWSRLLYNGLYFSPERDFLNN